MKGHHNMMDYFFSNQKYHNNQFFMLDQYSDYNYYPNPRPMIDHFTIYQDYRTGTVLSSNIDDFIWKDR